MAWLDSTTGDVIDDQSGYQTQSREWGNYYRMRTRERITEYRGLKRSAALDTTTFSDTSKIAQTPGTFYFDKYVRTITRRKANAADGWTVTKTEKWCALYQNETWFCGAPESCFTAQNPTEPT